MMQPIPTLVWYCGEGNPWLTQQYSPDTGWVTVERKRVSITRLRQLRARGVTMVGIWWEGRLRDFSVTELLSPTMPGGSMQRWGS